MSSGTTRIDAVVDNGGTPSTYTLTVPTGITAGVTVGDHLGARITSAATGPGGLWIVTAKGATSITVEDSLTEANASAEFGAPVVNPSAHAAWWATPAPNGLSLPPDRAVAWGAAFRRNAYLSTTA